MKATRIKQLSFLIASMILISLCLLSSGAIVLAETAPTASALAKEVQASYLEQTERAQKALKTSEIPEDLQERRDLANESYNRILDHIQTKKDCLSTHFSDAYMNREGFLVVRLACSDTACRVIIEEQLGCQCVLYEKGQGSYLEAMALMEKIDLTIGELVDQYNFNPDVSREVVALIETYPMPVRDDRTNRISIVFHLSPATEAAVQKARTATPQKSVSFTKAEQSAFQEYTHALTLSQALIGDYPTVSYDVRSGYEPMKFYEDWRPGRGIYVYHSSTQYHGYSSGYQASYKYNGTTYKGYLTSAHGNKIGEAVYTKASPTSTNKLGVILNRKMKDTVDVAFIQITNSNFQNSNAIYWTSSQPGVTRIGTILDGTQTTVSKGNEIMKSGCTTYLTSGIVTSTSAKGYFDDNGTLVYLYDLISTSTSMAGQGDSGAVTYITIKDPPNGGKAVGIVEGGDTSTTLFIKASNIKSSFGASACS